MKKITEIKPQVRNKDRVNIYVNGQYLFAASNYSVKLNGLKEGMEIDIEKIEEVLFLDDVEKAKGYVVDYHLNKTYKVIRDKLKQKGYEENVIEAVEEFLKEYNLIDDGVYAKMKSKDLQNINKKSKRMIQMELKRNGVSQEEIEEAMENLSDDLEYENAKKIVAKKQKEYKRKSENIYEYKNRIYRLLASKAYDSDIITTILREEEERWEEE